MKSSTLTEQQFQKILIENGFSDEDLGSKHGLVQEISVIDEHCVRLQGLVGAPKYLKSLELALYSKPVKNPDGLCIVFSYYYLGNYEDGEKITIHPDQKLAKIDKDCKVVKHNNYEGYVAVNPKLKGKDLITEVKEKMIAQKKIF
ncbi:hypothetical protein [Catenovulum sediminis]|uniref:Uncharacterized protein n=1 Tax=Catenovulum sediminis TaxID=1740262 RepID=A0ABV1RJG8_9ALTE|nr:hypothetical protein [Catenovulum sediminis]